jgi:hypothetical protein
LNLVIGTVLHRVRKMYRNANPHGIANKKNRFY